MTEKEKNRVVCEDLPVPRAIAALAVPTIISQLIILIYNMADTYFLGRTNDPLMVAGASLILPVFNICIALSAIAGTGGGTLISRLLGVGRYEEAKKASSFAVWFSIALAGCFSLGMGLFLEPMLLFLGASGDTLVYAKQYTLCVIVLGGVPTILSMTLGNLVRSTGSAKKSSFGSSMGAVLNIILDPVFMFVLLPRGKAVLGAGIATCISNCISCAYFIAVILRSGKDSVLTLSPFKGLPGRQELIQIFSVGIPAATGTLLFDIDYMVIDKLAAGYSDTALAAMGIVLKAERLPLNTGIGLCLGMTPLAAYNYSAGNLKRMKESVVFARRLGIAVSLVSIVLYEIFAPQIMGFFISDPATVALGTDFLRIREIATVLMFLSFIYVHMFNAVGRGNLASLLVVFRWAAVNIPMLFILNAMFGLYGIAWSQFSGDLIVAAFSYYIYRRWSRKNLPA